MTLTLPQQTYTMPCGALPDFVSILVVAIYIWLPPVSYVVYLTTLVIFSTFIWSKHFNHVQKINYSRMFHNCHFVLFKRSHQILLIIYMNEVFHISVYKNTQTLYAKKLCHKQVYKWQNTINICHFQEGNRCRWPSTHHTYEVHHWIRARSRCLEAVRLYHASLHRNGMFTITMFSSSSLCKCPRGIWHQIIQWWFVNPGSNNPEISLVRTNSSGTDFRNVNLLR